MNGRGRRFAAILVLLVAAQVVDVSPALARLRQVRTAVRPPVLASAFWQIAPPHYRQLVTVPPSMCPQGATVDFEPFALLAGDLGVPINDGFAARFDAARVTAACEQLRRSIAEGVFDTDALYVFQRDFAVWAMPRARQPIACAAVDGYVACAATETLPAWQDGYDMTTGVLPPVAEFLNAEADLDDEYARMQRPSTTLAGTVEERVSALRMYLVYRLTGCDHATAQSTIARMVAGDDVPHACGNPMTDRSPLPGAEDTFAFRRELETRLRAVNRPPVATRIDLEGEAVWLHEYARARLDGLSDEAAQDRVREMVRRAANR